MRALEDTHPLTAFAIFMAAVLPAMFSLHPVLLLLSLAGSVLLFLLLDRKRSLSGHLFSLAIFLLTALLNPLFNHNGVTVLFVLNRNPVTLEAVEYGLAAGAMLVSVLYWFRSFSLVMTGDRLLYLFGAFSPKTALLLSMTLRYIPLFKEQTRRVQASQKALGLYKEDNIIDTIRGGYRVFSVMVTWALENGIVTADSMTARGYGTGRRSFYAPYRFRRYDGLMLAAVLLISALFWTGFGLGATDFGFYPAVSGLSSGISSVLTLTAYGLLAFLPAGIQITQEIKWKILQSAI